MTMVDGKCDVCGVNPPIGVASTVIPYSCAYCAECAERFAQPDIVFEDMYENGGIDFDKFNPAYLELVTYKNGEYITYKEWAHERHIMVLDGKPNGENNGET